MLFFLFYKKKPRVYSTRDQKLNKLLAGGNLHLFQDLSKKGVAAACSALNNLSLHFYNQSITQVYRIVYSLISLTLPLARNACSFSSVIGYAVRTASRPLNFILTATKTNSSIFLMYSRLSPLG